MQEYTVTHLQLKSFKKERVIKMIDLRGLIEDCVNTYNAENEVNAFNVHIDSFSDDELNLIMESGTASVETQYGDYMVYRSLNDFNYLTFEKIKKEGKGIGGVEWLVTTIY